MKSRLIRWRVSDSDSQESARSPVRTHTPVSRCLHCLEAVGRMERHLFSQPLPPFVCLIEKVIYRLHDSGIRARDPRCYRPPSCQQEIERRSRESGKEDAGFSSRRSEEARSSLSSSIAAATLAHSHESYRANSRRHEGSRRTSSLIRLSFPVACRRALATVCVCVSGIQDEDQATTPMMMMKTMMMRV